MLTILKNSHSNPVPREIALYVQHLAPGNKGENVLEIVAVAAEDMENFYFGKCILSYAHCPPSRQRESSSEEIFLSNVHSALQVGHFAPSKQSSTFDAEECRYSYEFCFSKDSRQRKLSLVVKEKTASGSILFVKAEFEEQNDMNMMTYLAIVGQAMQQNQSKLQAVEQAVSDGNNQISALHKDITALTAYKDTIQTELLYKAALLLNSKARELQRRQRIIDSLQKQLANLTSDGAVPPAAAAAAAVVPSKVVKSSKSTKTASKATATRKRASKVAVAEEEEEELGEAEAEVEAEPPLPAKRKRAGRAAATSVDAIMKKAKTASASSRAKRGKKAIEAEEDEDDDDDIDELVGNRKPIEYDDDNEEDREEGGERGLDSNAKELDEVLIDSDSDSEAEKEVEGNTHNNSNSSSRGGSRQGGGRGRLQTSSSSNKSSFLPTPNIDIVDSGELDQLLRSQHSSKSSTQAAAPPIHTTTTTTTAAPLQQPRKKTALERKYDNSSDEDGDLNNYI